MAGNEKDFYTMEEVLDLARELALDIDERTFKYYLSLDIISKPVKNPYPQGDKRIKFYPSMVMEQLKRIFQLKSRGFSLKQIKKLMQDEESVELDTLIDVTEKDEKREMAADFLKMITGDESNIAWRTFLSTSISDLSEENLQNSIKAYLSSMLHSWMKSDERDKYVEEYFINLPPAEREIVIDFFRNSRDDEILKNRTEKMDLLKFLQKLCGRVILGRYNRIEVEDWIDRIIADLKERNVYYTEQESEDLIEKEMFTFMNKAIELYLNSIIEIKDNLSSKKREVLISALGKAKTAQDLLNTVEEISEKKKLLYSIF